MRLFTQPCKGVFWEVRGYSHRPNITNATQSTADATTAALNVATTMNGILASLGQAPESVHVLYDDAAFL